jgi:hypothetical protein
MDGNGANAEDCSSGAVITSLQTEYLDPKNVLLTHLLRHIKDKRHRNTE